MSKAILSAVSVDVMIKSEKPSWSKQRSSVHVSLMCLHPSLEVWNKPVKTWIPGDRTEQQPNCKSNLCRQMLSTWPKKKQLCVWPLKSAEYLILAFKRKFNLNIENSLRYKWSRMCSVMCEQGTSFCTRAVPHQSTASISCCTGNITVPLPG